MKGRERTRKKRLKQMGWTIQQEEQRDSDQGCRLILQSPQGEQMTVEAPTRPRLYAQAERLVFERQQES